jgi:hypothetical protein
MLLGLSTQHTHGAEWGCTKNSANGTFTRSTPCTMDMVVVVGTLEIIGDLKVNFTWENTVAIRASANNRHFVVEPLGKLTLRKIKLVGGDVCSHSDENNRYGGALLNTGEINLYSSMIFENRAKGGGAICSKGVLNIYNSYIQSNKGTDQGGGGIFTTPGSTTNIFNTTIDSNFGQGGGGGIFVEGNLLLQGSHIINNVAVLGGAGIMSVTKSVNNINITGTDIMYNRVTATSTSKRGGVGGGILVTVSPTNKLALTNIVIHESLIGPNKARKGNEFATGGNVVTSLINVRFDHRNENNIFFHKAATPLPTWKTCTDNLCTNYPFTGRCKQLDAENSKFGVYCPCVNCQACNPGEIRVIDTEIHSCTACPANTYTNDGIICERCTGNKVAPVGSTKCYDVEGLLQNVHSLSEQQGGIIKAIALSNAKSNEVKQKANGLIAKLSLNWATQDVINEAQRRRNQLLQLPEYNVKHHCEQEKQRLAYGVLRTGIIVPSDAEIDDKYCLNENRDRLISTFCNFRPRFIKLLQEKLYPTLPLLPKYTGRDLWPNICCRKDNFQHLKTCNDPSGTVPRSHIVPFALAQGGNITVDNLYGEIVDVLKKDGYLQQGMNKAVNGIRHGDKLKAKLNNLFETTLLCGPREFGLPTNEGIRLCELFYPYEHMLTTYYNEVNALLEPLQRRRRRMLGVWSRVANGLTNLMSRASGFVFGDAESDDENIGVQKLEDEIQELKQDLKHKDAISRHGIQDLKQKDAISRQKIQRLEKKDAISRQTIQRLEKKDAIIQSQSNKTNNFLAILKQNEKRKRRLGSAAPLADELCPFVTMSDGSEYRKDIDTFCTGYAQIDLNHPGTVINLAIMTPWDIPPKLIPELRERARYEISDDCPTPMFTANDISLQNVDGTDLFVVQLDATSPNGYLKKELPQCGAANNIEAKPHIPRTTIDVKIWRDHDSCCPDTKDYKVCKAIKCLPTDGPNGIDKVKDPWTKLQVGYYYKVTGTTYTATCDNKPTSKPCGSHSRRRNLLQDEYGNCGERL